MARRSPKTRPAALHISAAPATRRRPSPPPHAPSPPSPTGLETGLETGSESSSSSPAPSSDDPDAPPPGEEAELQHPAGIRLPTAQAAALLQLLAGDGGLAAVADALLAQARFSLAEVCAMGGLPSDLAGRCAAAASLTSASGPGASRAVRLAALRELCVGADAMAMLRAVPGYGASVNGLVEGLRPHQWEVNEWLWQALLAAEELVAGGAWDAREGEGEGEQDDEESREAGKGVEGEQEEEDGRVARANCRALGEGCLESYCRCNWNKQAELRDAYYQPPRAARSVALSAASGTDVLLLFGGAAREGGEAAGARDAVEEGLVTVFNKLSTARQSTKAGSLWSEVGRLALASPTLLLRKIVAMVAQQPGPETVESLAALLHRLGMSLCHYDTAAPAASARAPLFSFGLLAGCVSRQLEVSAHDARSVSSLIALVTRLAVEDGFVAVPELLDAFVLPHLAVDSESLPAALELLRSTVATPGSGGAVVPPGTAAASKAGGGGAAEDVKETVMIPNDCVGIVIGKGGAQIQLLQQQSGARIQMQKDADAPPGATERAVHLLGSAQAVAAARELLRHKVEEQALRKSGQPGPPLLLRACRSTPAAHCAERLAAVGCALCSLLCYRDELGSSLLQGVLEALAVLFQAIEAATDEAEEQKEEEEALRSVRRSVQSFAARLHWTIALPLPGEESSGCGAWTEGRTPRLGIEQQAEELDGLGGGVQQTLSDLLFSCALADGALGAAIELLRTGSEDQTAARQLAEWGAEQPGELWSMTVSCLARLLPRLARSEAERLLGVALPQLYAQGALPYPPPGTFPSALEAFDGGGHAVPDADRKDDEDGSKEDAEQDEEGMPPAGDRAVLAALHGGALAASLSLQLAGASTAETDARQFVFGWPYSLSELESAAEQAGPAAEACMDLAVEATRQALAALQQAAASTPSLAVELGLLALACGMLTASAQAAASCGAEPTLHEAGAQLAGCVKAAHVLAMSLLQRVEAAAPGAECWAVVREHVRGLPQPHRRELQKLVRRKKRRGKRNDKGCAPQPQPQPESEPGPEPEPEPQPEPNEQPQPEPEPEPEPKPEPEPELDELAEKKQSALHLLASFEQAA